MANNEARMRQADVIIGALPQEHKKVIDALTDDEVEVIINVKNRLEAAEEFELGGPLAPHDKRMYASAIRF